MNTKLLAPLLLTATFSISVLVSSCLQHGSDPKPDHCWFHDGDATCMAAYPDKPYCLGPGGDQCMNLGNWNENGCTDTLPPDECYSPCGNEQFIADEDSCLVAGDGDGDGDGDDGDGDGDGDPPCTGAHDCSDPAAPFCDLGSGECVSCDGLAEPDASCAEVDASMPVCLAGSCVQCAEGKENACSGATPICDLDASACMGCSDHAQCSESACNFAGGNCIDPAKVVHVNGTTPCEGGDGSEASPYCTIQDALVSVDGEGVIILHEMETLPYYYVESNTVQVSVALFAAAGDEPVIQGTGGDPGITVAASGNLYMRGVTIAGTQNGGQGLVVAGGGAWIERSKLVNNTGGGIRVESGGALVLENSFVGGDIAHRNAVDVAEGSALILYSTLVGGFGSASALFCDNGADTVVRNSLLVASTDADELVCSGATITNSALELALDDNTSLGPIPTDPNEWFINYANGDFGLADGHPAAIDTTARWLSGDPTTDIDGDPRPTSDGTPDFAGADLVP